METCDLLISNGTLVDGTGVPGYSAEVAVLGDRMRILDPGESRPNAAQVIDATGKVVAPGFIDLHSHSGLMALANPRHEPKVRQTAGRTCGWATSRRSRTFDGRDGGSPTSWATVAWTRLMRYAICCSRRTCA
jgi:imidazolonepropionase-like amidohydrolase